MFTGDNLEINGGTFNLTERSSYQIGRTQSSFSFEKLTQKASHRAFHLADSDLLHSTCFRNTRTNVLGRLKDWALGKTEKDKFIVWLQGAAGGGKTSIARTIAKWCDEDEGILLGEFFFSRGDGIANQFASLVPTLAYRMAAHTCTEAKEAICNAINQDPHILSAPLASQLKKLVLEPFDEVSPKTIVPYVIILDGLDETLSAHEQLKILEVLSEMMYKHNSTLRILICSRPEPIISSTFKSSASNLKNISTIISLNDEADSDSDIRLFLVEKFRSIREELPYPPSTEWPTPDNIDYLVAKSSGQFIFAATVERYVCSPKHRHQAIARLKHVLDLGLLDRFDRETHPFVDLDALYALILKTRIDVKTSVKTMAICFEYPKYFTTISPQQLAKVLGFDLADTWSILYELASLLEITEENVRPFHASFSDFLFDSSRSGDFYRSNGDVATDIICAMLTPRRDPRDLPCRIFFYLLNEASPRHDLMRILSGMSPASIFSRPPEVKTFRSAYRLISLLKVLEKHVSLNSFSEIVSYFDQNFASLLRFGRLKRDTFCEDPESVVDEPKRIRQKVGDDEDDRDPDLGNFDGIDDDDERRQVHKHKSPESSGYPVSQVAPLSTSFLWDEINARLNIRLVGSDFLQGLCDEAHFTRNNLPATSAVLLDELTQTKAADLCVREMAKSDIPEDIRNAFAKLLPHALARAKRSSTLTTNIKALLDLSSSWTNKFPEVTMRALSMYLNRGPGHYHIKPYNQCQAIQKYIAPLTYLQIGTSHSTPSVSTPKNQIQTPFTQKASTKTRPSSRLSKPSHPRPSSSSSSRSIVLKEPLEDSPPSRPKDPEAHKNVARKAAHTPQRPSGSTSLPTSNIKRNKSTATSKPSGEARKSVPSIQPPLVIANTSKNQTPSSSRGPLVLPHNQTSTTQKALTITRPSSRHSTSPLPRHNSRLNVPKSPLSKSTSGTSQTSPRPEPSPDPSQPSDEARGPSNTNADRRPSNAQSSSTTTKSGKKTSNTQGEKVTRWKY